MTTGQKVKALRLVKGWTQTELAQMLNITKTYISHIENDRDIPLQMVVKLAKIFDTTPAYLMGWEKNPEQKHYLYKTVDELTDEQFDSLMNYFEELKDK